MSGKPENAFSRLLRQLSGDKTPAKPVTPAAPNRPASFYDPPEDITRTPGEPQAERFQSEADALRFQSEADALRFERPGAKPGAAVPPVMHEFRDEPPVPIPPKLATLTEQGGKLVIAYAPLRKLAISIVLLLVGSVVAGIGLLAVIGNPQTWAVALGMVVGGGLLDMLGAHLLVSNLQVVAGGGQLRVEKRGLFGRKQLQAAGNTVTNIEPTLSYTVTTGGNSIKYYTVTVHTTGGARVPVGHGIPASDVADSIAYRIAAALKLPPEVVTPIARENTEYSS